MTDMISRKAAQTKLRDMADMLANEMPKDEVSQRHVRGVLQGLREAAALLDFIKAEAAQ
jgi:mRNA-degrading endonuclease YafQ of YafQ-DinJ toxin-antitoxin module